MNRVANLSAAQIQVGAVTRRRARTRLSFNLTDGAIAMVLIAASLICYSYYHQMQGRLSAARAEHARVEAEIAAIRLENARIAGEIKGIRSDPEVIERVARQELGMTRPGEIVLVVDRASRSARR